MTDNDNESTGHREAVASILESRLIIDGVTTNTRVGIACTTPSSLQAAVQAVWSLGAGYVDWDNNAPKVRLRHLIDENKLGVVLTEKQHLEAILATSTRSLRIIVMDGIDAIPVLHRSTELERPGPLLQTNDRNVIVHLKDQHRTRISAEIKRSDFIDLFERSIAEDSIASNPSRLLPSGLSISFEFSTVSAITAETLNPIESMRGDQKKTDTCGMIWHRISCMQVQPSLIRKAIEQIPKKGFGGLPISVHISSTSISASARTHLIEFASPWVDEFPGSNTAAMTVSNTNNS